VSLDFPFFLFSACVLSGAVMVTDYLYCRFILKKPVDQENLPWLLDYARSFFPVLLLVFILRSFLFEPFRVPTGSLKPTVLPGDFIVSNKYAYGVRTPIWARKLLNVGTPQRGDIAIFRIPVDQKTWMVKRVIGTPGDRIDYEHKQLTVNGERATYRVINTVRDTNNGHDFWNVQEMEEILQGKPHRIYINDVKDSEDFHLVVPPGHYFMMGDNRDNSDDSRYWGFVPDSHLEGKAMVIWLSWDQYDWKHFRWDRIGSWL
jgi:signal peptidase I